MTAPLPPDADPVAKREAVLRLKAEGKSHVQVMKALGLTAGVVAGIVVRAQKRGDQRAFVKNSAAGRPRLPPKQDNPAPAPPLPAPAPRRSVGPMIVNPQAADAAELKAEAQRAQAHAARMATARPQTEAELRALIDRHLAEKGATPCPTMGQTSFDNVWERLG